VVLAVDRRHVLGQHAVVIHSQKRKNGWAGMQIQRAVGLMAMKKNGDRGNRDVGDNQGIDDISPPRRQIKTL